MSRRKWLAGIIGVRFISNMTAKRVRHVGR